MALTRRQLLALGAGATALAAGCAGAPGAAAPGTGFPPAAPQSPSRPAGPYFPPTAGPWETADPATVGADATALGAALDLAVRLRSTGVVILHRGRVLAERYAGGATPTTRRDVASCQKGVVALLVQLAAAEGRLSLDDPVSTHLAPGWSAADRPAERRITIRHLLQMTSGLDGSLRPLAPPGRVWSYNTRAYGTLQPLLAAVSGRPFPELSRVLLDAVGAADADWRRRPAGGDRAELGLVASPRSMARIGLLVLGQGRWGRRQVLPAARVAECLRPSQRLNPAYGLLWWLNGQDHLLPSGSAVRDGPLVPAAPPDLVAALGAGDQKLYVVPGRSLVVVRQGGRAGPQLAFDRAFWSALAPALPPA